ncbi:hypothetical protein [Micromonospora auratinigra]|uniref:DUF2154 domain-containing protein n=1 Tax=Micromonospora auratinigra TaxID=261654 RepID=A0A1A8Z649_9ACTN|nr:hypothetical protein [Micromonospora auratinigra]SBT39417.1 hypothetical protein GA0070611_0897 [Micromonospora auratinigra]
MASDEAGQELTEDAGWSGGARLLAAAALLVVALGVVAVLATLSRPARLGVAFSGGSLPPAAGSAAPGGVGAAESAAEQTLAAPLSGRRRADFELVDGLTTFELRIIDLGEDLYRISTPADAGVTPRPEVTGDRVRLRVGGNGGAGPSEVQVLLNSRATWRLRLVGGVREQLLDLGAGRLAGVELAGGSARTRLRLPALTGPLTVRLTGGVHDLVVTVPGAPPARVRVGAGAGAVSVYRDRRDGVGAGELLGSPGWDRARVRLYLDLVAGANTVTVATG